MTGSGGSPLRSRRSQSPNRRHHHVRGRSRTNDRVTSPSAAFERPATILRRAACRSLPGSWGHSPSNAPRAFCPPWPSRARSAGASGNVDLPFGVRRRLISCSAGLPAVVGQFLEATKAVTTVAEDLAGPADVAELLRRLQQPGLRRDHLPRLIDGSPTPRAGMGDRPIPASQSLPSSTTSPDQLRTFTLHVSREGRKRWTILSLGRPVPRSRCNPSHAV